MAKNDLEKKIIDSYKQDEEMMILVFAQWCVNHSLDPVGLYTKAYLGQGKNPALQHAISLTVPKEEAGEISNETLFGVLSLFGNDDLAEVVMHELHNQEN